MPRFIRYGIAPLYVPESGCYYAALLPDNTVKLFSIHGLKFRYRIISQIHLRRVAACFVSTFHAFNRISSIDDIRMNVSATEKPSEPIKICCFIRKHTEKKIFKGLAHVSVWKLLVKGRANFAAQDPRFRKRNFMIGPDVFIKNEV